VAPKGGGSATEIALERLGRALPNAVLLGLIPLVAVAHALRAKFGSRAGRRQCRSGDAKACAFENNALQALAHAQAD
jgi:hypothetical protein